jgi:hypothetical protein
MMGASFDYTSPGVYPMRTKSRSRSPRVGGDVDEMSQPTDRDEVDVNSD